MDTDIALILVVEDDPLLLQAITKKLQSERIDVVSCDTGQKAIEYLKETKKMPQAIWLDYYLSDMNGITFMKAIQGNEQWKGIPVFVVSNSASHETIQIMQKLGIKQYIVKADNRLEKIIAMIEASASHKKE
jgi:CheY-like chemotaxis protein